MSHVTITDRTSGEAVTVPEHLVAQTLAQWYPEAPAEVTDAIEQLEVAILRGDRFGDLEDYLDVTVERATRLTRAQAAAVAGVQTGTWSAYVARGQAPQPVERIVATPLWDAHEVAEWMRTRPGQGNHGPR